MLNDVQNGEFNRYLDWEATDIYINHIDTFLNCVKTLFSIYLMYSQIATSTNISTMSGV